MDDDDELSREEELYDEYLNAILAGRPETPGEFCARHGITGGALMRRLEGMWAMSKATRIDITGAASGGIGVATDAVLGDYRLLERLGGGGMGIVHRARQLSLDREVAVKVMTANLQTSPIGLERFQREARALARVRHPSVVNVHECGESEGVRFLVMELVEGESLDRKLTEARNQGALLPSRTTVRWFAQLARALAAAHAEGIIHRDVKPSNILIAADGHPVLIDFGLARDLDAESITMTEAFMGSPAYAAPEQVLSRHGEMDGRSDVYSLGATLYECLTGHAPFAGGTIEQIFHKILLDDPAPLRALNPAVSRDLEVITLKAMAKEPGERYQSAAALADDLDALLEFRPISARPPTPWRRANRFCRRNPGGATAILMAILAVVAVLVALGWRTHQAERERIASAQNEMQMAELELIALQQARAESRQLDAVVRRLEESLVSSHVLDAGYEELRVKSQTAATAARAGLDRFYSVLEHVRRAQQLDAEVASVDELLARLYMEKFEEAIENRDRMAVDAYRRAVADHDLQQQFGERLMGWASLSVTTTPPGASVRAFIYREQSALFDGGAQRLVPVPIRDGRADPGGAMRPGTWALEVRADHGGLRRGELVLEVAGAPIEGTVFVTSSELKSIAVRDRIIAVDDVLVTSVFDVRTCGGIASQVRKAGPVLHKFRVARAARGAPVAPDASDESDALHTFEIEAFDLDELGITVGDAAVLLANVGASGRILREGKLVDVELPRGLSARTTAAPCDLSAPQEIGPTPIMDRRIEPGDLLLFISAQGYETQRVPLRAARGAKLEIAVDLLPLGITPAGFAAVVEVTAVPARRFWIQEFEVTAAEWLEFLNDPETLAQIEAADDAVFYPRGSNNEGDNLWPRTDDGEFWIQDPWRPDWPVLGISHDDAIAYARWRTRRAQNQGLPHRYALPTLEEWQIAAGRLSSYREYVYGDDFRPRWTKSCFSRRFPDPEPIGSFPTDESPYGIFDVGGSAFEWLDSWWEERKGSRRVVGGAWGQGTPVILKLGAGVGMSPNRTTGETGVRLALHMVETR